MVEAAVVFHQAGKRYLAGMAERGVTQVVGKADGFDQVLVRAQGPGDGPPDLRHLQGVGQAGAEIIAFGR